MNEIHEVTLARPLGSCELSVGAFKLMVIYSDRNVMGRQTLLQLSDE
jgi:hypothetical protein